jgi:hypothetical protein
LAGSGNPGLSFLSFECIMRRERTVKLLLVIVSTLLTLVALEVVARVLRSLRGGGKEAEEFKVYMEYDPLLGWRKIPQAKALFHRREYRVEIAMNSLGLRDPERGYQAPAGTLRLLALGDSFLEAHTVELPQMVSQVLERSLRSRGCPAEVVNGGTAGYSTDQEYLFYTSEGVKYSPRIVLLFLFYNDIVYNDRQDYNGRPKPIFQKQPGGLELHRYPVKRLPPMKPPPDELDPGDEPGRSALFDWVRERLWYGAPRAYGALARLGLWRPMPRVPVRLFLRVYQRGPIEPIEQAWDKTADILEEFDRAVSANGARFLCLYVPSYMEIDDRSWELTRALYDMRPDEWDRNLVAERLRDISRQRGFAFLDLTPALREADRGLWRRTYFPMDGHWTSWGHEVAAGAVSSFLAEHSWISCGADGGSPH